MIAVDANLLIYATTACAQHDRARQWLDQILNDTFRVGFPWICLLAFLRVVTDRRIYTEPLSMQHAWYQIETWFESPNSWIPAPTGRHFSYLKQTLAISGNQPRLVSDAHLAALAMEHGLTLCSADVDFARFPDLKWTNPLTQSGWSR